MLGRNPWTARNNAQKWKRLVFQATQRVHPKKPIEKALIIARRHNWRMLDFDGCVGSFKPVIDGLVPNILIDDRWTVTGRWEVDQVFRPKKEKPFIEVIVKEIKV